MSGFIPQWAIAPGETIKRLMKYKGISTRELSFALNLEERLVFRLLEGTFGITEDFAEGLSNIIGSTPDFWMKRENQFRSDLTRLSSEPSHGEWTMAFPINDMIKYNWISAFQGNFEGLMSFFRTPDITSWKYTYGYLVGSTPYRSSRKMDSSVEATATWLRAAEIDCENQPCKSWNSERLLELLPQIKSLSRKREPKMFRDELTDILNSVGVAISILPTPTNCAASGAAQFVGVDRPMIALSDRYKTDDHFWFTLLHELGHIILHGHKNSFLEFVSGDNMDSIENEANQFAEDILIPFDQKHRLMKMGLNRKNILRFASDNNISPGLVVGQLQHKGRLTFRQFNGFKRKYNWEFIL